MDDTLIAVMTFAVIVCFVAVVVALAVEFFFGSEEE